jgi:steroid 5-alpha reductase family enzyme
MIRIRDSRLFSWVWIVGVYSVALTVGWVFAQHRYADQPFVAGLVLDLVATVIVFLASWAIRNSSTYDPYWSVGPVAVFALWWLSRDPAADSDRVLVYSVLLLWWAWRLTWNWALRWHGLGDEDFRYVYFRKKMGVFFPVVDFFGIHLFPTVQVFLGIVPGYFILTSTASTWNWPIDGVGAALITIGITLEFSADRELRRFRRSGPSNGAVLRSGIWSQLRYPNYLGEILFWYGGAIMGFAASGDYRCFIGAVTIHLMFVFVSLPLMEERHRQRRPAYAEYKKNDPGSLAQGFKLFEVAAAPLDRGFQTFAR